MGIIVQKFGGTSVADIKRIKAVAQIVKKEIDNGNQIVAVVSAMAGVTNSLITKCDELSGLKSIESRIEYDAAIASGEIITASLLALELQEIGVNAMSLQGWQVGIVTDNNHTNAQILNVDTAYLKALVDKGITPVITGFQGVTVDNRVSTLGKGGSDTSASVIAGRIKAIRCDIYTDVKGIYSADPRIVNNAKKIDYIDTEHLCALCCGGAKVLHPRAASAAKKYGFEMRVLSSFEEEEGTLVRQGLTDNNDSVIAITSNKNLLQISCDTDLEEEYFVQISTENNLNIDMFFNHNNVANIIFSLEDRNKVIKLFDGMKSHSQVQNYTASTNISSVTIVGYDIMTYNSGIIDSLSKLLAENDIDILFYKAKKVAFSLLIDDKYNEKAIKILHEYFFEN